MTEYVPPQDTDPYGELANVLARDKQKLEAVTTLTGPLTLEALGEIDPAICQRAEEMAASALLWPSDSRFVDIPDDSFMLSLQGNDADTHFINELVRSMGGTFANFRAVLAAEPDIPVNSTPDELFDNVVYYETKPCMHRAHALFPHFMASMQRIAAQSSGNESFYDHLLAEYADPDFSSGEQPAIITGTRIAYALMGRLIHPDDRKIQMAMLGRHREATNQITDPVAELRA